MNATQKKLFDRLPSSFEIVEDFRKSNCPPTIVRDLVSDRELFRFARGDARTFESLRRQNKIEHAVGKSQGDLIVNAYFKNP